MFQLIYQICSLDSFTAHGWDRNAFYLKKDLWSGNRFQFNDFHLQRNELSFLQFCNLFNRLYVRILRINIISAFWLHQIWKEGKHFKFLRNIKKCNQKSDGWQDILYLKVLQFKNPLLHLWYVPFKSTLV